MHNPLNSRLKIGVATLLALCAPIASAHGLDGHHAPFMTVLQHLFFEHGYLLVLPFALGMVWFFRRERAKQAAKTSRRL